MNKETTGTGQLAPGNTGTRLGLRSRKRLQGDDGKPVSINADLLWFGLHVFHSPVGIRHESLSHLVSMPPVACNDVPSKTFPYPMRRMHVEYTSYLQAEVVTASSRGLELKPSRDTDAAPAGSPPKKPRNAQQDARQGPAPSRAQPASGTQQPHRTCIATCAQSSPDPKPKGIMVQRTPVQTRLQRPRPPPGALSAKALAVRASPPAHAKAPPSGQKKAAAGKAVAAPAQQGRRRVPLHECVVDGERFRRGDCAYVINEGCEWEVTPTPSNLDLQGHGTLSIAGCTVGSSSAHMLHHRGLLLDTNQSVSACPGCTTAQQSQCMRE